MVECEVFLQQKKILVVDDAFAANDIKKASLVCTSEPLARFGTCSFGEVNTHHYVTKSHLDVLRKSQVFLTSEAIVKRHFPMPLECHRIVYREVVFGDHMTYHVDSKEGQVTAMIYMNETWDENNRGETLFMDQNGVGTCVMPKPGRLLVFDSSLRHTSSSPGRTFFGTRQVLVFNFSSPS